MQLTYLEAIRQGIWEEMEHDPSVFCLGEDIGIYGGAFKVTDGFIDARAAGASKVSLAKKGDRVQVAFTAAQAGVQLCRGGRRRR